MSEAAAEIERDADKAESTNTSLMLAPAPNSFYKTTGPGRKLNLKLWQRQAVEYYLTGMPVVEIAATMGKSPGSISKAVNSEQGEMYRQQLMIGYDKDFESLFPKVVKAIDRGLESDDNYMQAAQVWLKAHGRLTPQQQQTQVNVTAEDVVVQILNQGVTNDSRS